MSREFPDLLNPWKAADGHRTFEGTMPLRRMRRLVPLLAPEERAGKKQLSGVRMQGRNSESDAVVWKDAGFRVDFAHDTQGTVTVELWVEAELPLICQRSLRPYLEPVKRHSLLAVVESLAEQDQLPEYYEPVLVEHGRMALLDLVEDELLLAVPQVPRDPAVEEVVVSTGPAGDVGDGAPGEPTQRPFEGLAGLLRKRSDD
jgi:uncharacterized protein